MKKILFIFLASLFLVGCTKSAPVVVKDHQIISASIGESPDLMLEVVNTPQSITQGLSGRDEIGADGMLFIFDQPRRPSFWMKEMKFNLDLIWIRDMKIIEITENVLAPDENTPLNQVPTYSPQQPVDMVLEVAVGRVKDWGIEVGDELDIPNTSIN